MSDIIDSSSDHGRKREFISRRKFWMEAGMGIGGLALLDLLSQDRTVGRGQRPLLRLAAGLPAAVDSLLLPKPPHFKPRAKVGDFALHERRREPHRHLPIQAGAREVQPDADGRARRDQGPPRLSRTADAEPVQLQTVRTIGRLGLGNFPEHRDHGGRSRVHSLLPGSFQRPRDFALRMEHRLHPDGIPERRCVGDVRSRQR